MKLTKAQKEKIKQIAQKYNLKLVLLFGSQVSGYLNRESDVDIAFLPSKKLTFKQDYTLNYEFTNVFGTDKVDTVNLKTAPPLLMKQIIDNCQILYQLKPMVFDYFEAYARQRYQEAAPLFEMTEKAIKRFVGLPT